MRKTALLTTLMMACLLAVPYGALQHTPALFRGLPNCATSGHNRFSKPLAPYI